MLGKSITVHNDFWVLSHLLLQVKIIQDFRSLLGLLKYFINTCPFLMVNYKVITRFHSGAHWSAAAAVRRADVRAGLVHGADGRPDVEGDGEQGKDGRRNGAPAVVRALHTFR